MKKLLDYLLPFLVGVAFFACLAVVFMNPGHQMTVILTPAGCAALEALCKPSARLPDGNCKIDDKVSTAFMNITISDVIQ